MGRSTRSAIVLATIAMTVSTSSVVAGDGVARVAAAVEEDDARQRFEIAAEAGVAAGQTLLGDHARQAGDDAVDLVEVALVAAERRLGGIRLRAQVGQHVLERNAADRPTRAAAGDDAAEPTSQFCNVDHTTPPAGRAPNKKSLPKRQTLSNAYGVSCRVRAEEFARPAEGRISPLGSLGPPPVGPADGSARGIRL